MKSGPKASLIPQKFSIAQVAQKKLTAYVIEKLYRAKLCILGTFSLSINKTAMTPVINARKGNAISVIAHLWSDRRSSWATHLRNHNQATNSAVEWKMIKEYGNPLPELI